MTDTTYPDSSFHKGAYLFSWTIVFYTVVIILWGAWVRISGSGDGCGDHWPLCNGEVVPLAAQGKTWVEYSHRISTAIYGVFILLQIILLRARFPKKHPTRFWSSLTLLLTITEALIGRQLVVSGLVNESVAVGRLFVMPLHLLNTALLVTSTVITAESIRYGQYPRVMLPKSIRMIFGGTVGFLLLVLTSGAVAALGSHLSPSHSILEGLAHDISQDSHLSVRLRIIHPVIALLGSIFLWGLIERLKEAAPSPYASSLYSRLFKAFGIAVIVGVFTLLTLAPVWLKITHLLLANILIILTSLCIFHSLRPLPTQFKVSGTGQISEDNIDARKL